MTSVLIAHDRESVREHVRMSLVWECIPVVAECADGLEAVAAALRLRPGLALIGLGLARLDGIEATRRIVAAGPATRVAILVDDDRDEHAYEAVLAGAVGVLPTDTHPDELVRAARVAAGGGALLDPERTKRLLERHGVPRRPDAPREGLSDRELRIVRQVAAGRSNAEIGAALYLSEATVKTYVSQLLAKLGLRDRVQLTVFAYERGLVTPGEGEASPNG